VRLEIATALRDENVVVVPVLVGGAAMPNVEELPDDLKQLTQRNAIELSDSRWVTDVNQLIEEIEGSMPD
jgi:hypothetical protein